MTNLTIRDAKKRDLATILDFVRELAIYEKAKEEVVATEDDLYKALFGKESVARTVICELDGKPIGFALYFFNFSTWLGKLGLYLEDLYVSRQYRGMGAGLALMKHLARVAKEKNCCRFEWSVLDWNKPAIGFYESIGAKPLSEWIGYRLQGEDLERFCK